MKPQDFINELHRMCHAYIYMECNGCPVHDCTCNATISVMTAEDFNALYKAVEDWSDTHPISTRRTAFLKLFPDALLNEKGTPSISPCHIDSKLFSGRCSRYQVPTLCGDWADGCSKCTADYWNEIIEDDN